MPTENEQSELVRLWDFTAAPNRYKELLPFASELYWIALVPASLAWEFIQQLQLGSCSNVNRIKSCRLQEGSVLFCGPFEAS